MEDGRQKQIDILLRDHYRHGGTGASLGDDSAGQHMDADELSSYAEHSLPLSAREHFTRHLANCAQCSSQLAALAPLAVEALRPEPLNVEPDASLTWLGRLRALFRAPSFRYALPTFVVLLTIAGIFIAVRNSRKPSQLARVEDHRVEQMASEAPMPQPSDARSGSTGESARGNVAPAPRQETAPPKESESLEKSGDVATAKKEEQIAAADKRTDAIDVANRADQDRTMVDQLSRNGREREASPPVVASNEDSFRYAPAPPSASGRAAESKMKTESSANAGIDGASKDDAGGRASLGAARKASPGFARSQPAAEGQARDEAAASTLEDAEVRAVGMKSFRKSGDRWIDVNYGGGAVVNVRRGSEQFRALMSDEPDLKAILQRLSGDVLVVWHDKAYRFIN